MNNMRWSRTKIILLVAGLIQNTGSIKIYPRIWNTLGKNKENVTYITLFHEIYTYRKFLIDSVVKCGSEVEH